MVRIYHEPWWQREQETEFDFVQTFRYIASPRNRRPEVMVMTATVISSDRGEAVPMIYLLMYAMQRSRPGC